MEKIWIDIETTGINIEDNQIIEIAAICKGKTFHRYCLPEIKPKNWSFVEGLTGITWEFLEKNGLISEAILHAEFVIFLNSLVDKYDKKDKLIFSGYKTGFDASFVRDLFIKNDDDYYGSYFMVTNLDVMSEIASLLSSNQMELLGNYKLKTVCEHMGIKFQAHSAIEDIKATIKLYEKIQERRQVWTIEKSQDQHKRGIETLKRDCSLQRSL